MKSTHLPIVILLTIFLNACSRDKIIKYNLGTENLIGKVKSVKISTYEAEEKFGEAYKGALKNKIIVVFNNKGNIMEQNTYFADGSLTEKAISKYDKDGNVIEQDIYNESGNQTIKNVFVYNKNTMIEQIAYNLNDSSNEKTIFRYDDKDNIIAFYDRGKKDSTANQFDEKGNIIEMNSYDTHGNLKLKIDFKYENYDKIGNWLRRNLYMGVEGKLLSIREREIEYYQP